MQKLKTYFSHWGVIAVVVYGAFVLFSILWPAMSAGGFLRWDFFPPLLPWYPFFYNNTTFWGELLSGQATLWVLMLLTALILCAVYSGLERILCRFERQRARRGASLWLTALVQSVSIQAVTFLLLVGTVIGPRLAQTTVRYNTPNWEYWIFTIVVHALITILFTYRYMIRTVQPSAMRRRIFAVLLVALNLGFVAAFFVGTFIYSMLCCFTLQLI